jgi:hypothetical protein
MNPERSSVFFQVCADLLARQMRGGAGSLRIGSKGRFFGLANQFHCRRSNLATTIEDKDKRVQRLEDSSVPAGLDGFEQQVVILNPEMRGDSVVPEYLSRSLLNCGREKGGRKEQKS